jgi:hypothetical protein
MEQRSGSEGERKLHGYHVNINPKGKKEKKNRKK